MVESCSKNAADPSCELLCQEFNINKYTILFDGQPKLFKDIATNYADIKLLITNSSKISELFDLRTKKLKEIE